jgi:hypothetical protein
VRDAKRERGTSWRPEVGEVGGGGRSAGVKKWQSIFVTASEPLQTRASAEIPRGRCTIGTRGGFSGSNRRGPLPEKSRSALPTCHIARTLHPTPSYQFLSFLATLSFSPSPSCPPHLPSSSLLIHLAFLHPLLYFTHTRLPWLRIVT